MSTPTTPQSPEFNRQASTLSRTRFFDAFDSRNLGDSVKSVVKKLQFTHSTFTFNPRTCERWLRLRRTLGSSAIHRPGKSHKKLSKITDADLDTLLSASSEIRTQPLDVQIEFYHLHTKKRNLQLQLWKRRKARHFKKAWCRAISKINQGKRVSHCLKYKDRPLAFWYNMHFSDEAHIDPSQSSTEWILREEGTRLEPRNMQMEHHPSKIRVHVATTISWHHKGPLHFYNAEPQASRPRKPVRRPRQETEA